MTQQTEAPAPARYRLPYDEWMESLGLPIHRGYFVQDVRTVELGWWEERQCQAAIIQLAGQEGVAEARVSEIPPGATLPANRFAFDEVVYVAEGRGLTTVWGAGDSRRRTFEWQKHSLFMLPNNRTHQFSNTQGDRPARLLHFNYLPLAMSCIQDPEFFFNNPYAEADGASTPPEDFYSEAKVEHEQVWGRSRALWYGNFFPDMRVWDKLVPFWGRGAGGTVVHIRFLGSQMSFHMSVFYANTYKKAHRHGPGRVIIIP